MIKAIDRQSINRICSGQVVVDLSTAIKEVRLFEYTTDSNFRLFLIVS